MITDCQQGSFRWEDGRIIRVSFLEKQSSTCGTPVSLVSRILPKIARTLSALGACMRMLVATCSSSSIRLRPQPALHQHRIRGSPEAAVMVVCIWSCPALSMPCKLHSIELRQVDLPMQAIGHAAGHGSSLIHFISCISTAVSDGSVDLALTTVSPWEHSLELA